MSGGNYTGAVGERIAQAYLEQKGMQLMAHNVRLAGGEIDLVMRDGKTTVFCEVKTRTHAARQQAYLVVDAAKRRRICQAALAYAQKHRLLDTALRFDVVVLTGQGERMQIDHIPAAFAFETRAGSFWR